MPDSLPNGPALAISTTPAQPQKPGWQTTEFWVSGLTIASVVTGALIGVLPGQASAYAAGISAGAYSIARGLAKLFNRPLPMRFLVLALMLAASSARASETPCVAAATAYRATLPPGSWSRLIGVLYFERLTRAEPQALQAFDIILGRRRIHPRDLSLPALARAADPTAAASFWAPEARFPRRP